MAAGEHRWIELPYSLAAAAIMGAATVVGLAVSPVNTLSFGDLALAILSFACLLCGLAIHFGSLGSRHAKYELLMLGLYGLGLSGICYSFPENSPRSLSDYLPENFSPLYVTKLTEVKMVLVGLFLVFCTTFQLITSLFFPASSVRPGLLPSKQIVRTQRFCRGIGMPLIVISAFLTFLPILIAYLYLRYVVGKR